MTSLTSLISPLAVAASSTDVRVLGIHEEKAGLGLVPRLGFPPSIRRPFFIQSHRWAAAVPFLTDLRSLPASWYATRASRAMISRYLERDGVTMIEDVRRRLERGGMEGFRVHG